MMNSNRILQVIWLLLLLSGVATAQVLNMSRDLVRLGIANRNLTPNDPTLDARPLIQSALQYVKSRQFNVVTLDKGKYYLLTPSIPGNSVLLIDRFSNMTLDLGGSTIYFIGPTIPNGIALNQCKNFTLTNFQIDFLNAPYTHVRLAGVEGQRRVLTFETIPGWPHPSSFNNVRNPFTGGPLEGLWIAMFRDGEIVPGTTRSLVIEPISGNTLSLQQDVPWTESSTLATLRIGDTIAVTARGGGPPIYVGEGDGVTLSHISVYGSPTWAVNITETANSTVDDVRVLPRPGSGLIGANADGIHFPSVRQNNVIRNSYVTRTMDDALAMDSYWAATVLSQTGPRRLRVRRNIYARFPNGTPMNFVDPLTTAETNGATIVAQDPPDGDVRVLNGEVDLTFDRDLPAIPAGTGMAWGNAALRGQGSVIEDNLVEDLYSGRGIWLSGVRGVTVRRNVIRRTSMAGITSQTRTVPELDAAPPTHDLVIRDNSLEGTIGPAAVGTGTQHALAAIQMMTLNQSNSFVPYSTNTNIDIFNNYIADAGRSGIWIGQLKGGTIENNGIFGYNRYPRPELFGIGPADRTQITADFAVPIVVRNSSEILVRNNNFSESPQVPAPVTFSPNSNWFSAAPGTGSFVVQTQVTGFGWKASSDSSWLIVDSGETGTGDGTIRYRVLANETTQPRTGRITVAGVTFTLNQHQAGATIPTILAVADAWSYSAGIAPGAWVTIAGTTLAPQAITWNPPGPALPTTLGDVTVTFNGTPAVLSYVSPTQINMLVPSDVKEGPVEVIVRSRGLSSLPFRLPATTLLPAVYTVPSPDGGLPFVTAVVPGTASLVGNRGVDPRVIRAARTGELIDLYMIGLGATTDATKFVTNQVFAGAYPIDATLSVTIGSQPALVSFAGLVSPGLYLVRVRVPVDLALGNSTVRVRVGETAAPLALLTVE